MAVQNPFMPTFGVSPSILGGRDHLRTSFGAGLAGSVGDPRRTLLISGPRGIGKTVMLNELEDEAMSQGWVVLRAHPYSLIAPLVDTAIPAALEAVRHEPSGRRRITAVSIAGIGSVTTQADQVAQPAPSLITSLAQLCSALPPTAGVLITLDEVQSASPDELWELTAALQDLRRDNYYIAFAAAGLPEGIARLLKHPGTTFLRRAQHAALAPMSQKDAGQVLRSTAAGGGVRFAPGALYRAVALTRGYPFLVQLLGFHLFERAAATDGVVDGEDLDAVVPDVLSTLGQLVHEPALANVPQSQLDYLGAMAELQEGQSPVATGNIAAALGKRPQELTMARQGLIERELVYSPRRGYLNFLIPHLGHHLMHGQARDLGWD